MRWHSSTSIYEKVRHLIHARLCTLLRNWVFSAKIRVLTEVSLGLLTCALIVGLGIIIDLGLSLTCELFQEYANYPGFVV